VQIPVCNLEFVRELADNLQNLNSLEIVTRVESENSDFSFEKKQFIKVDWGIFV
jgi:hypothetical protein